MTGFDPCQLTTRSVILAAELAVDSGASRAEPKSTDAEFWQNYSELFFLSVTLIMLNGSTQRC